MAVTSVASGVASVSLLAAANRREVIITNTDANRLYVLLDDGTASATNHSFSLAQYENAAIPEKYTGAICGIWAGDGSGVALVTSY